MKKQDIITTIQSIGGKVYGEVEVSNGPYNRGVTIAPHSSFTVEYNGSTHELIIYIDNNGNVNKSVINGQFSKEIKQKANLP